MTTTLVAARNGEGVRSARPSDAVCDPPEGEETILVVEDEDALRRVTRKILERGGYRVLEARDGREALQICEQHTDSIHLMVIDVVLPEMNGPKIAQHVARVRPTMRTLFVSGYPESAIHHYGVLDSDMDLLQKPFDVDALLHKVREMLDRPTLLMRKAERHEKSENPFT